MFLLSQESLKKYAGKKDRGSVYLGTLSTRHQRVLLWPCRVTWELHCRQQAALPGCKDSRGFEGKLAGTQCSQHVCAQLVHAGVAHAIWEVELPDSTGQGPWSKVWVGSKWYDLTDWVKFQCLVWRVTTKFSSNAKNIDPEQHTYSSCLHSIIGFFSTVADFGVFGSDFSAFSTWVATTMETNLAYFPWSFCQAVTLINLFQFMQRLPIPEAMHGAVSGLQYWPNVQAWTSQGICLHFMISFTFRSEWDKTYRDIESRHKGAFKSLSDCATPCCHHIDVPNGPTKHLLAIALLWQCWGS